MYNNKDDIEPVNKFDFEFEFLKLEKDDYRDLIYDEMLYYNYPEISEFYHDCIANQTTTMYHIINKYI